MAAVAATAAPPPQPHDGVAGQLRALADALGRTTGQVDDAFVRVGGRLSECASILSRLTAIFESLPRDLASEDLAAATDRIALVGRRVRDIATALSAEQQDLALLVAAVAAAEHPIADLGRAAKMMSIVAVNARVVAAAIVDDLHDFDVFTTDIAQLSSSATAAIAEFSRAYVQLRTEVTEAAETHARFEAGQRDPLASLGERLAASLEQVTDDRLEASRSSAATGALSAQIGARVASTVMALQIGDATRQRLEHTELALRELAAMRHGDPIADMRPPEDERQALVAGLCELQRRQLRGTAEAFDAEVADGYTALTALAHDAGTMFDRARQVYGSGDAQGQSGVGALQSDMRRAIALLRECERERGKLDRLAAGVAGTVKLLFEHVAAVQDIEAEMRLVSLNAAVRCAQLGPRGKALDVISLQLRGLTSETVVSATAAVERLNEAAALAERFNSAAGAAAGQIGDLEREAAASLEQLASVAAHMTAALAELGRSGPVVAQRLRDAAADLSNHTTISEALRDLELGVAALADAAPEPLSTPAAAPILIAFRRRYTMDAERRIHDDFVGVPAPTAEVPSAAVSADNTEAFIDDLLF